MDTDWNALAGLSFQMAAGDPRVHVFCLGKRVGVMAKAGDKIQYLVTQEEANRMLSEALNRRSRS